MMITTKCKICEEEVEIEEYKDDNGITETTYHCPICGYFYNQSYGNTMEIIDNEKYCLNWDSPSFKKELVHNARNKFKKKWELENGQ